MKKLLPIILIALSGIVTAYAQNSVTLTFACQTTEGYYLQPDSIVIENLTRNWSETIYYPDTVYTLNVGTDVQNHPNDNGMQVMPNPFNGSTRVKIQSPRTENVKMKLSDISGRVCAEYNGVLQEGGNLFSITLSIPQMYVLSVQTSSGTRSMKMENVGRAGANRIAFESAIDGTMSVVNLKSSSTHAFEQGDTMRYQGYASSKVSFEVRKKQNENGIIMLIFDLYGIACPGVPILRDYDGNMYNTVQIGNQCWMKENLRVSHYENGEEILSGDDTSSTIGYRYRNNLTQISKYGYLYNWTAIMHGEKQTNADPSGISGICPSGWHIPSNMEWKKLIDYINSHNEYLCEYRSDSYTKHAKALAATSGWMDADAPCSPGNDMSTNNATGFSAFPSGRFNNNHIEGVGYSTFLWSTTEKYEGHVWYKYLNCNYAHTENRYGCAHLGESYSIRCIRDDGRAKISTDSVTIISDNMVTIEGHIQSDGGNPIISNGICWSISDNPTINDFYSESDGSNIFSIVLSGLSVGIPYYVRAYAINSAGVSYGDILKFAIPHPTESYPCPDAPTVTDIDGNVYNTVQIGSQCWIKENLRTTRFADFSNITLGTDTSSSIAYRYYPNNDSVNVSFYGMLYNWRAARGNVLNDTSTINHTQGICPTGWHLPSNTEVYLLENYVSSQNQYICMPTDMPSIAVALADSTSWLSSSYSCAPGSNLSDNNATGFSARPAGSFYIDHTSQLGSNFCIWVDNVNSTPWYMNITCVGYNMVIGNYISNIAEDGYSVRCVKD